MTDTEELFGVCGVVSADCGRDNFGVRISSSRVSYEMRGFAAIHELTVTASMP